MKIVFFNRFFFPDTSATSQILSDLASQENEVACDDCLTEVVIEALVRIRISCVEFADSRVCHGPSLATAVGSVREVLPADMPADRMTSSIGPEKS